MYDNPVEGYKKEERERLDHHCIAVLLRVA